MDELVARRIAARREELGLSPDKVGFVLGVPYAEYKTWEGGQVRIPALKLLEIAELLGVSVGSFYSDILT